MSSQGVLNNKYPKTRGKHLLRKLAAVSLFIALISQSILLGSSARSVAQSPSNSVTKGKKSAKKKKSARTKSLTPSMVLPSLSPAVPQTGDAQNQALQAGGSRLGKQPVTSQSVQVAQESASSEVKAASIQPIQSALVNVRSLSSKAKAKLRTAVLRPSTMQVMPEPQSIQEVDTPGPSAPDDHLRVDIAAPLVPSPGPSTNYQGAIDEAVGGGPSGTFTIPPDTMGAVGIDKVVSYVNNNIVIQDKATGAQLNLMGITAFWTPVGATGVFDPRVQYDPYNNRWILSAVSSPQSANSSVLIGVSQTSDPQGTYLLQRFIVGCAPGAAGCNAEGGWADFPMLGFNKNWVAIAWNQFTINTNAFTDGRVLVFDYPSYRAGTVTATLFSGASAAIGGFCLHPATTFSATEDTLYIPTHISSAEATYRLHRLTGTPAAPILNVDPANRTRTGGGWTQPGGDNLPQQCIPGVGLPSQTCPTTIRRLDVGDAFIRSNVVFRNGKIYYPQTVALPTGGLTTNSRFAAQWTVLNSDGTFSDGGRVEDATATLVNGGKNYAYPSIGVNKHDDVILGFTECESDDYADAGYTFRLGSDPAGSMRDPVIYKAGEDYYSKTFGGTRNRWGDYSHSVVDPVNDRDLWTMQEYAMLRVGTTGQGSNDSRWGTWWAKVTAPAGAGDLLISEFRLSGPSGANDEFVEVYNPGSADLTVTTADGSGGYSVAASDGVIRFTIPNGTVIPARGHYLGANSVGYSISSYPAGNGTTATADATYTTDIPNNVGIALFQTSTPANFALATRIDAVGSTSEANSLYKEGSGYPALTPDSIDYSFVRDTCGKGGSITTLGACPTGGLPKDTNNNASDFYFVDTNGTSAGAGQRLGAPGPENLSAPLVRNSIPVAVIDPSVGASQPPNRIRDFTSAPAQSSTFGTLLVRRTLTNNTGGSITRLRFRIVDFTTFPAPSGFADLRARASSAEVVAITGSNPACPANNCAMLATTVETPPSQPNGGAFNSTLSAGTITLANPIPNGAAVNLNFLLGIQQTGTFKFFINVEVLP